jgi:nucleoside-diphosphate-sugar epimerase
MAGNPLSSDLDQILLRTRPLWEELRGRRLFVTGGTGFFGCWLLESFAWANQRLGLGAEMVVLTRNLEAFRKKAPHLAARADIQFHIGDARDFAFPAGPFSHVIHAATEAAGTLNDQNPGLMLETIVTGTRRALECAARCGAKKFLLTSSGAVYGVQPPDMTHLAEEHTGAPDVSIPRSAYGEGKRLSELLCAIDGPRLGIETKIARCFAFVGPYLPLDAHFAIGNFIRDALAGGPIAVKGDGTPFRSYLYAADLAAWLWTILCRGAGNRPYNVGSSQALTIAETAAAVARALGENTLVTIAQKPAPGQPAQRYVPNINRAANELQLDQWTQLDDAIRATAQWHRLNRRDAR